MQWFTSLDVWVQALLASLMMYLMTALGASFVFFSKKINKTVITALTGLAAGIMIFFNHIGKRRITHDPTPIEVSMRKYEDDVNNTLAETWDREGNTIDAP